MTGTWVGMHHYVAQYVPLKEIWISNKLPKEERDRVIIHEFTERQLMEKGMPYNLSHIEALKAEGNLSEAEIKEREYIKPEETKQLLNKIYPISEKQNTWKLDDKVITFDEIAGIIYLYEGDKITDQLLIRSAEDINKFVEKHRTGIMPNIV